jgi:O-antigen ligase
MGEIVKLFGPVLFLSCFLWEISKNNNFNFIVLALFFTSIVSFSQNFTFYYREAHQLIQLIFVFLFCSLIYKRKTVNTVVIPLLVFSVLILFSLMMNTIDTDAINQTINFVIVFCTTLFLFSVMSSREQLYSILNFIGRLGFIASLLAIVELMLTGISRVEVTFANPNYLALFLGLSFVCVYYFFNKFKYTCLIFILLGIVLTGSRSALIIPVLVYIKVFINDDFSYKKIFFILTGAILVVSIALSGKSRVVSDEMNGSDAERLLFAKIAYNMTVDNPWFGVGWGRFIDEFSLYSSSVSTIKLTAGEIDPAAQERRVTHNDLLRISSELGLGAFFISLCFIFWNIYLLTYKRCLGFDFLFAIWFGFIFFSLTHNNLNTAFSWFFILMPYFLARNKWIKE